MLVCDLEGYNRVGEVDIMKHATECVTKLDGERGEIVQNLRDMLLSMTKMGRGGDRHCNRVHTSGTHQASKTSKASHIKGGVRGEFVMQYIVIVYTPTAVNLLADVNTTENLTYYTMALSVVEPGSHYHDAKGVLDGLQYIDGLYYTCANLVTLTKVKGKYVVQLEPIQCAGFVFTEQSI